MAQVVALQVEEEVSHLPLVQVWVLVQIWHGWPPLPQAASLEPATQAPWLLQQPVGQVVLLQTIALHCWLSQISLGWQVWQALPPLPQTPGLVPGMQVLLKQQPLGQVAGPQAFSLHWPDWHCSVGPQTWQTMPPVPQAESFGFLMHCLPWQQPAQLAGPQGSLVQAPLLQRSSVPQAVQNEPFSPQVCCEETEMLSGTQIPLTSQHPGQDDGPQAPDSSSPQPASSSAAQPIPSTVKRVMYFSLEASG